MASRDLTAAVLSELAQPQLRPALLFKAGFADWQLRLWSGLGDLSWDSETWLGNGWLQGMGGVSEAGGVDPRGCTVQLSGLPVSLVSAILTDATHGSDGSLWLAFLQDQNLENLITQSETISTWDSGRVSCTADSIANPVNNGLTGDRVAETADTGTHYVLRTYTQANGAVYEYSIYAKAWGRTRLRLSQDGGTSPYAGDFDLAAGTVLQQVGCTASIQPAGGGWYRCAVSWTATASGTEDFVASFMDGASASYAGDTGKGMYLACAQVRRTLASAAYVKTLASAIASAGYGDTVIADPYLLFSGRLDYPEFTDGPEGSSLALTYESKLVDLKKASAHLYTYEGQRAFYPDDEGFAYVSNVQQWNGTWGRPA